MDTDFENYIDDIMTQKDVKGVLVTDETGLCLAAKGSAPTSASGYITTISLRARELGEFHHQEGEIPTIVVQNPQLKIFVRTEGQFTIAIYYSVPQIS